MTKTELFEWAAKNNRKYPELKLLCETTINGVEFLNLPVKYGIYKGQYFCFKYNKTVKSLRREGYAVGVVEKYETVKLFILECVKNLKTQRKKNI